MRTSGTQLKKVMVECSEALLQDLKREVPKGSTITTRDLLNIRAVHKCPGKPKSRQL